MCLNIQGPAPPQNRITYISSHEENLMELPILLLGNRVIYLICCYESYTSQRTTYCNLWIDCYSPTTPTSYSYYLRAGLELLERQVELVWSPQIVVLYRQQQSDLSSLSWIGPKSQLAGIGSHSNCSISISMYIQRSYLPLYIRMIQYLTLDTASSPESSYRRQLAYQPIYTV